MTETLMGSSTSAKTSVLRSALQWWRDTAAREGSVAASRAFVATIWEFLRDSTPARKRQRYGDFDFDWERRVNTTSAAVAWRERLLGVFHSAYQPTEPALFREMMDALLRHMQSEQHANHSRELTLRDFTFIDLGSGKGRVLMMASDYPFRRIVGIELLPALHQIALENLAKYRSESQRSFALESVCADATKFRFPAEPIVLYLFNPFPESGLRKVLANLEQSLRDHPRAVYVLYHNPLLEHVLREYAVLRKIGGTDQYSVYSAVSARRSAFSQ
jgi:hypothetical protein